MKKKKKSNLKFYIAVTLVTSPFWGGLLLDAFDKETWENQHYELRIKLYECEQLYTGYSRRGDGIPPLKGGQIHSKDECKEFREKINKYHQKLYNEEYPYDWKGHTIEDWKEFRIEGEVKNW